MAHLESQLFHWYALKNNIILYILLRTGVVMLLVALFMSAGMGLYQVCELLGYVQTKAPLPLLSMALTGGTIQQVWKAPKGGHVLHRKILNH